WTEPALKRTPPCREPTSRGGVGGAAHFQIVARDAGGKRSSEAERTRIPGGGVAGDGVHQRGDRRPSQAQSGHGFLACRPHPVQARLPVTRTGGRLGRQARVGEPVSGDAGTELSDGATAKIWAKFI